MRHKTSTWVMMTVMSLTSMGSLLAQEVQPASPVAAPVESNAAPPPAARTVGWLDVDSQPQGLPVRVNGIGVGVTPLRHEVAEGMHTIQVEPPGAAPLVQPVQVAPGVTVMVRMVAPPAFAPAPSLAKEAKAGAVGRSLKDLGKAVMFDTPWVGFVVVAAVGAFLVSALLWTSTPKEIPFQEDLPNDITNQQWKTARWVSLVGAASLGTLALVLLLIPATPLGKVGEVLESLGG